MARIPANADTHDQRVARDELKFCVFVLLRLFLAPGCDSRFGMAAEAQKHKSFRVCGESTRSDNRSGSGKSRFAITSKVAQQHDPTVEVAHSSGHPGTR